MTFQITAGNSLLFYVYEPSSIGTNGWVNLTATASFVAASSVVPITFSLTSAPDTYNQRIVLLDVIQVIRGTSSVATPIPAMSSSAAVVASSTVASTVSSGSIAPPQASSTGIVINGGGSNSLSGGAIAGIVIGCFIGVCLIVIVCFYCFIGRTPKKHMSGDNVEAVAANQGKNTYETHQDDVEMANVESESTDETA